ncbi:MAG: hypothetical protein LBU50_00445 [Cellulomonas sp.]|jgi:hypothetical protein|nr:hypothetical protein [Cellulomonas sp.]
MTALLADVLSQLAMADTSESDDGGLWLLLAGPAAGAGMYWTLYRHYRNTDKSHSFERETTVIAQPVQGGEQKVDEIHGTRSSTTDGRNESSYRRRVQRIG